MSRNTFRQMLLGLSALGGTVMLGTIGYMVLEQWGFLDALYMTVITMSTTGFNEVHDLSKAGRLLTLVLIILGIGSVAYASGRAVQLIFEMQFIGRRRMSKKLEQLNDHFIVCGYGKMGKYICEDLSEKEALFVVIENETSKIAAIRELGYLFVEGDATSDDTLTLAGIGRARGLVTVLGSDADNVFTTLSAKSLNQKIFVVARAVEEETEPKLLKAGASRVVKPYETAGTKMAELLLRPGVIEFIDIVARDKKVDLNIEEVHVGERSPLVNRTLAESNLRQTLNIIIVTINKPDGKFIYNPQSSTLLEAGDRLIALGERANLLQLSKLCLGE